jgi:8-oxo-dGTP diphosphatase
LKDEMEFVSVSNDVFSPTKHYITVCMRAEQVDPKQSAVNVEADKCEGWLWLTHRELLAYPPESLFLPLRTLLHERKFSF